MTIPIKSEKEIEVMREGVSKDAVLALRRGKDYSEFIDLLKRK